MTYRIHRWLCMLALVLSTLTLSLSCAPSTALSQSLQDKSASKPKPPELVLQIGHAYKVRDFAYSANGKLMASIDAVGILKVWDAPTSALRYSMRIRGRDTKLSFSPDSTLLCLETSPEANRIAIFLDALTGTTRHRIAPEKDSLTDIKFSPSGGTVVCSVGRGVEIWDSRSWQLRLRLSAPSEVQEIALSYSGDVIAASCEKGVLALWKDFKTPSPRIIRLPNSERIFATLVKGFSRDGSRLLVATIVLLGSGELMALDVETGSIAATAKIKNGNAGSASFSPDGQSIMMSKSVFDLEGALTDVFLKESKGKRPRPENDICLLDAITLQERQTFRAAVSGSRVEYMPDGKGILVADDEGFGGVAILSTTDGSLMRRIWLMGGGTVEDVAGVAISPDNSICISVLGETWRLDDSEAILEVWSLKTGSRLNQVWLPSVPRSIVFSPDGKRMLAGCHDGKIRVLRAPTWQLEKTVFVDRSPIWCLSISPAGNQLSVGSGDYLIPSDGPPIVRVFSLSTLKQTQAMTDLHGAPRSVAWSPNGQQVAAISNDKMLRVWEVNTGRLHRTLTNVGSGESAIWFTPDGLSITTLGSGLDGNYHQAFLKTWRLKDSRITERRSFEITEGSYPSVSSIKGGSVFALAMRDQGIQVHRSGTETGHTISDSQSNKLAISQDGRRLVTGGDAGLIRVYDLNRRSLMASMQSLPLGSWITHTADGYFNAPPEAQRFIRWRDGGQLHPASKFDSIYRRKDKVAEALNATNATSERESPK